MFTPTNFQTPTTPLNKIHSFVSWNCQGGLAQKKAELTQFLTEYQVTVLLLQETWLKPGNQFSLKHYHIYRDDRQPQVGVKGGTAIAVRKNIPHTRIPTPPLHSLEATTIEIGTPTGPLTITSAYKRPKVPLNTADLDSLLSPSSKTIIAGDLNCKHRSWGCKTQNTCGSTLELYLQNSSSIEIYPPSNPTHLINGLPHDILDIVLHTNQIALTVPKPLFELTSDHLPIIFSSRIDAFAQNNTFSQTPSTNWLSYTARLSRKIKPNIPLNTPEQIDQAISHFTHQITNSYKIHTTYTPNPQENHNLPIHILHLITLRRRAQRHFYKSRTPEDRSAFYAARRKLQQELTTHHRNNWESFIQKAAVKGSQDMWKTQKIIRNPATPIAPLYATPTSPPTYDPTRKAEIFADTLEARFQPPTVLLKNAPTLLTTDTIPSDEIPTWQTDLQEVKSLLKSTNPKKAPGPDKIKPLQLKHLPKNTLQLLTNIFNACTTIGYFPNNWKEATIAVLPKPGKNYRDPANYRPISLLPIPGKIYEKLLLTRLNNHLHQNKTIKSSQFGFKRGRSAAQQVLKLTFEIASTLAFPKKSLPAIFFDLSFAFDSIHHQLLLQKTKSLVPKTFHSLLTSFLSNRTFKVRYQSHTSSQRKILAGVPQGSVLSPTLFSLFLNDIPSTPGVQDYMYADDVAFTAKSTLFTKSVRLLQKATTTFQTWCRQNGLTINNKKCQTIIFTRKHNKNNPALKTPPITILNNQINWGKSVQYLGVLLDHKLTWSSHVKKAREKVTRRFHSLKPLLTHKRIPTDSKVLIYNACITSLITYACEAWLTTRPSNILKLQKFENRTLRQILHPHPCTSNETIRQKLNITPITIKLTELATKRLNETLNNTNDDIFAKYRQHINKPVNKNFRYFPTAILQKTNPPSDNEPSTSEEEED